MMGATQENIFFTELFIIYTLFKIVPFRKVVHFENGTRKEGSRNSSLLKAEGNQAMWWSGSYCRL